MNAQRSTVFVTLSLALILYAAPFRAAAPDQRPIELADIMAWRSIGVTALSEDGEWFGYRIGPTEGDGEFVIRQTKGEKEYTFAADETPAPVPAAPGEPPSDFAGGGGVNVAFSRDAMFAAFTIQPSHTEAA